MSTDVITLPGTQETVGTSRRPLVDTLHGWVTTVDHKRLGLMYILYALVFLLIGGVGIIDPQGQMKFTFRIEPVDSVESLGHLAISLAPFGSKPAGSTQDRVDVHESKRLLILIPRPEFKFSLEFVDTKKNRTRWIGEAGRSESLSQNRQDPLPGDHYAVFRYR